MPINSFNPLSNTIDMEPSTRELASYSNQYNGFITFQHVLVTLSDQTYLEDHPTQQQVSSQYLSFNLPITYMIYAMCIHIYTYIHLYICIYIYIHTIFFISLCFGCHGQQCSVRPRSEEFMSNAAWRKKHTYTYLHYTIMYIYIYI